MQITLPFFAFVSLSVTTYVPAERGTTAVETGYITDKNEQEMAILSVPEQGQDNRTV